MGLFDTLSSYFPTAYADNQAHPTEESDKAYGAPHEDSEDVGGRDDAAPGLRAGGRDEDKSAKTTLKETDSSDLPDQGNKTGEASGDDEEEEEEESGGDDEEEEEEEEEDEPVDVMPKIQEDCAKTSECAHHKHDFDDCVARVHAKESGEIKGHKEDCVEEFFHLTHCVNQCAAPKLWKALR